LSSRSEDAFPDSGQQVAKEVASQLAIAVQQAGLRTTLVRERKWLQTIVRHLPEGVALLAADGRVLFANPAGQKALAMFGHDPTEPLREIQGRTIQQLEQRSAAGNWTDLVVEKPERRELDVFVTHANSGADQTVIVIRDTTVERDVRRQLNRQERLAGVGQMASGISHDFNNLLFAIMANAEVLARDGTASPQVVTRATSITEMARRGGRIIRQILDFSRKSISAREPLDIGHFVNESLPLIRHAVPQSIALDFDKPTGKLMVLADPARVEQMLTNLIVNARDAMPKGGNITVSLARTMTTNTKTNRPGQWISLQVRDTGGGIPAELQKRVFEPYFTTKGLDQGTGLGLAQVLGIVQDHGGQIALQSDSTGTTFTILLPAITVAPLAASAQDSEPLPSGSGELVLLVEDDENVREPVRDNLELLGYRVIAATNGVDALSLFADHAAEVRVVLTDAVMPRMGGIELLRVIRDRNPSVGTILMSGTPDAISEAMTSGTPFLEKPFALSLLARTIRDVLVG
jgi:signal transduction histidine kinase